MVQKIKCYNCIFFQSLKVYILKKLFNLFQSLCNVLLYAEKVYRMT